MAARALVLALLAVAAWAQPEGRPPRRPPSGPGPVEIERFNRLSPERRQELLDRLPPARRQALEERIERYNRLSPEEKDRLRRQFERFRRMPRHRQEDARLALRELAKLDPDRVRAIREEVESLRRLTFAERQERFDSPDFGEKFSARERRLIRELESLTADPAPRDF